MKTSKAPHPAEHLFPLPRRIKSGRGTHRFSMGRIVASDIPQPGIYRSARRVQATLAAMGLNRDLAGHAGRGQPTAVALTIDPAVAKPQGYRLTITPKQITLTGHDEAGLAYAATTFAQLVAGAGSRGTLPCLTITDWPDFEKRGIMLDVSRDKVPTMATLFLLIDRMAAWKLNELQLYTEHTFAYVNHRTVWADASPITPEEILQLNAYCRERGIELVPNQNTFGHCERWLKHEPYAHLAECPEPTDIIAWGKPRTASKISLCPIDPGSLALIDELLTELLPNFSSRVINVGCDETIDLGYGRSKPKCQEIGKGRVYLDYLLGLREVAARQGRRIQFWGDIILHHPELIPELPKDITALVWGYEQEHPFAHECAAFQASGLEFYVCPGTSSWSALTGRRDNAVANLHSAAENGLKHGAQGYLITDWGDGGHWQPIGTSHPLFALGAALSWANTANQHVDPDRAVSTQVYGDATGTIGRALRDMGTAATLTGLSPHNSSVFQHLLTAVGTPLTEHEMLKDLDADKLMAAEQAIAQARASLDQAKPSSIDGKQACEEIRLIADLALHACKQGRYRLETTTGAIGEVSLERRQELRDELRALIRRHRKLWLKTNRPGGLEQSAERMKRILTHYRSRCSRAKTSPSPSAKAAMRGEMH